MHQITPKIADEYGIDYKTLMRRLKKIMSNSQAERFLKLTKRGYTKHLAILMLSSKSNLMIFNIANILFWAILSYFGQK
ncbi:MAG: hypothetical protein HC892_18340 [Saprospiraceae bacterium]|nr:hypothetical protein [Saprospiraceae bacterium]